VEEARDYVAYLVEGLLKDGKVRAPPQLIPLLLRSEGFVLGLGV
jgi:hypothetical protein